MLDVTVTLAETSAREDEDFGGIHTIDVHSRESDGDRSVLPCHRTSSGKKRELSDEGASPLIKTTPKSAEGVPCGTINTKVIDASIGGQEKQQRNIGKDLNDQPTVKTRTSLREAFQAGKGAFDRFRALQRDVDLDDCIESWETALALCPIGNRIHSYILSRFGIALQARFDRRGNMADLEESICRYRDGLSLHPPGHALRSSFLNNLGSALGALFDRTGDFADLEESIRYHQEALSLRPIGNPDRPSTLNHLGNSLGRRFDRRSNLVDLEESIHHHREALTLRPSGHPDRPLTLNNLGNAFGTRFDRAGEMADLEERIRCYKEAMSLCPPGDLLRPSSLNNLGSAFKTRFDQRGNMADLEESIGHHKEALSLHPVGHKDRPSSLNNLGNALRTRFERGSDLADLETSICHYREDLSCHPIGDPLRPSSLNNLGSALKTRFDQKGAMADIEESIHHHQEALFLWPAGHTLHVSSLNNLGSALRTRFKRTGDMADLEESIYRHQEALSLRPIGHPGRPSTLDHLGNSLGKRFDRLGNMADLEESIRHYQEALPLMSVDHSLRPRSLNHLGSALKTRFDQRGNMADLEGSIRYHKEALSLPSVDHTDRASGLNNLGNALRIRFGRRGDMADLEESICHYKEALSLLLENHFSRLSSLNNLGSALKARFDQTGVLADLEESIWHYQEALSHRPIGHPDRTHTLNNVGNAFQARFERSDNVTDLEESIRHHQEALSIYLVGHPDQSLALNSLANALSVRFEQKSDLADLQESIRCYREATGHKLSPLSIRLCSAHNWIKIARQHSPDSLGDAYAAYMNLFDRSLLLAASSIPDTHAHMLQTNSREKSITEDATSHAIEKNQLSTAVEVAERGRALLFTQLGNYRTPLQDLEILNKELAGRFRTLSAALERSSTLSPVDAIVGLNSVEDQVARHQKMAADWEHTIEEIRQFEGFQNFLGVTPFTSLQNAAVDGPVILVNISCYGSFALIIKATGEPLSISLPRATPNAISTLTTALIDVTPGGQRKGKQSLADILRDLWTMIVAPIVLHLETTLGLPDGSRIWWMPTSAAWWLPLHAAGPYKPGERSLPDRFISSYTPTLSSLIRSRAGYQPTKNTSGPRMLVVAQAEAEGQAVLPSVTEEVTVIRRVPAEVTVVDGEDCTRVNVLSHLKDTAWVHFSCHGYQDPGDPFKSRFSLRALDAPLTILDIIENGLPRAELAFLSACHSAAVDESTPDEAINFAASILFAGFRSVIGTMWAMYDPDGPVITKEFYKYMFRNGPDAVDCRDAAKALVMGVRELRRRKVPAERWVNFVHYGI
ncbi:hypothetical protein FRB94_007155 [Tulasnella sp. JGI-2019a]|nr:hypothetical protein FRB94_007155 [Tulasnella sp. JGI-2019a]